MLCPCISRVERPVHLVSLMLHSAHACGACCLAVVPVGYAAADDTTVFSTTVSSISSITRLVACPQGFYCTGGDPTLIVPTPCNSYINTAGTGSTKLSDCNCKLVCLYVKASPSCLAVLFDRSRGVVVFTSRYMPGVTAKVTWLTTA